jgi:hypothetical protein
MAGFFYELESHWRALSREVIKCNLHFQKITDCCVENLTSVVQQWKPEKGLEVVAVVQMR